MVPQRILVVEDNRDMVLGLTYNLEFEGYEVHAAYDCATALEHIHNNPPDLMLLDLMLPDMSGFDFLRSIRQVAYGFPVVILSARGDEADRVAGLKLGAQDYVTKPFSVAELLERIKLRLNSRDLRMEGSQILRDGSIHINIRTRSVHVDGAPLPLTPTEFDLLTQLVRERGNTLTRADLLSNVWRITAPVKTRTVDFHIMKLRGHLRPYGLATRIRTVARRGFTWTDN